MIFAPRSCPSRPGLAMTTRILRATARSLEAARRRVFRLERLPAVERRVRLAVRHEDENDACQPERERRSLQDQKTSVSRQTRMVGPSEAEARHGISFRLWLHDQNTGVSLHTPQTARSASHISPIVT